MLSDSFFLCPGCRSEREVDTCEEVDACGVLGATRSLAGATRDRDNDRKGQVSGVNGTYLDQYLDLPIWHQSGFLEALFSEHASV